MLAAAAAAERKLLSKMELSRIVARAVYWDVFTDAELDSIIEYGDAKIEASGIEATVMQRADCLVDPELRSGKIAWILRQPSSAWIFDRLEAKIHQWNKDLFQFEIDGVPPALQYTVYNKGNHYDWHFDQINSAVMLHRKLSLSLFLNSTAEYTGGEFQIKRGARDTNMIGTRGACVVFPSYILHRVTPVITGVKKSLVAWVNGPKFR